MTTFDRDSFMNRIKESRQKAQTLYDNDRIGCVFLKTIDMCATIIRTDANPEDMEIACELLVMETNCLEKHDKRKDNIRECVYSIAHLLSDLFVWIAEREKTRTATINQQYAGMSTAFEEETGERIPIDFSSDANLIELSDNAEHQGNNVLFAPKIEDDMNNEGPQLRGAEILIDRFHPSSEDNEELVESESGTAFNASLSDPTNIKNEENKEDKSSDEQQFQFNFIDPFDGNETEQMHCDGIHSASKRAEKRSNTKRSRNKTMNIPKKKPTLEASLRNNLKTKRCDVCGKEPLEKHYKRHMLTHQAELPFKCNICSKQYSESWKLIIHKRSHAGNIEEWKPYACELCHTRFTRAGNLKLHMITHLEDDDPRKLAMSCDICGKSFSSNSNLNQHRRNVHNQ